ncbi:hypothetical protein CTEN210_14370 [Chaetoceros tenuissimus]|uniref:Reverse transcriptase Ty1/copia-type domain-containing protein n=1 Tax=Chaetoceros tenuissimus TaxID=426638 RepID=A0AAD3CSM0_9STRA|nr:hypothetical protein CTEN210_04437 [Chaetoceros tenuissimus]GFH50320.1 hypothetical protein CTEN210_06796 [Chaetoceros tenuissimus]GFH57894.1 hypothetical protein CTEN210_14370 [Chaetoceros tenuissimus]
MVVLGSQCFIIEQGGVCDVSGFAPGSGRKGVRVVDAAVAYDDPYTGLTHILLFKNALYCPDMEYNLIPSFILREAGLTVNETPKFQCKDPTIEDHSIYSASHDLRIHLQLHGTFSYFNSRKPNVQEIQDSDEEDLVWFTPEQDLWDPYLDTWQMAEASMLDENGDLQVESKREKVLIPTSDDEEWMQPVEVSSVEAAIDSNCITDPDPTLDGDPIVSEIRKATSEACKAAFMDDDNPLLSPIFTTVDDLERTFGDVGAMRADKVERASPEFLSKIWSIKIDEAERALEQNTILYNRPAANDLSRRAMSSDRRTRYKRIRSNFFTDTFFVDKKATTKEGFNCMQLFVSDKGFVAVYPMKSKSEFPKALKLFCKEVGVPERLVVDGAREQKSKEVKSFTQEVGTTLQVLEESTQWANRAELYIGLFKKQIRKDLQESKCPMILWDYCARRRALINNLTPKSLFQLQGRCAHEVTTGSQGDMSNLLFGWYEWVKYTEISDIAFPAQRQVLGRCLGPTKNEGNTMSQTILTAKGTIVPRRTVRPLTTEEIYNEDEIKERENFDKIIQSKYGTHLEFPVVEKEEKLNMEDFIDAEENIEDKPFWVDGDPVSADNQATFEQPVKDLLVGMELNMPQVDEMRRAKVLRKSTDSQGETVGEHDANPLISTLSYDIQFDDGEIQQVGANIIAQNLYSQIDGFGNAFTMLEGILDHDVDGTQVKRDDSFVTTPSGAKRRRKSTQGWSLKILWNDGSKAWVPLAILKESNPIEVAEYAKAMNIIDDPSFVWWAPHVLKKRNHIISKVEARVKKVNHKYGIEVPKDYADAVRIDGLNENTFWQDAIKKEMDTIRVAFSFMERGAPEPEKPWMPSGGHLVFDVKMDFTRKARWVKNGYLHDAPTESTFAGVVSRETVRLCLTYAALNDLNVMCCDFKSAYLQAKTSETHYIVCGPEFGEHEGCYAKIKRALYGGKSAGADYWKTMRSCMECLKFKPCKGDQDLWMRPAVDNDGNEYWEYVCLYTDDALVISVDPERIIRKQLGKYWTIKEESIAPPNIYLGNKVSHVTLQGEIKAWSLSSSQYVQASVANVEKYLAKRNMRLPKKASSPLSDGYRPELDTTPELDKSEASYYMSLVGILRWIVELNRIDIAVEVSMMASVMALPRKGHLDQLFHMFAFLKIKHNAELVLDPSYPEIDESLFERKDWTHSVYGDVKEEVIPETDPNYRKPRGKGFVIRAHVDSDHAGDSVTRRSRTGFIVHVNNAPIYWFSKKQVGIETSTFGSEFIAMKQCCEYLRGLRFKLRSMGIPVEGPCYVFGDNKSVLTNSSQPFSVLSKKSNSIAYHFVREGSAKDEWRIAYINTDDNCADMLTKPLVGMKRRKFTNMLLMWVYEGE